MKKILLFSILGILLLLSSSLVLAAENQFPTQQFNKIYLSPFYRVSLALNTNYTYNVSVTPPDKISKVVNAIVSFNVQVNGQTQTFTLWVNGKSCNNPIYSIATAFSTTGQLQAYFDCSNVINQSGTYTVTLNSAANTGAISGWLDLTYMNKPLGSTTVFGTEYVEGDDATIFLLLKDSYGIPIENATCSVDIYYPNIANLVHPEWINNGLMLYKEEGIYYYDFTVPLTTGLYMVSATCTYSTDNNFYYRLGSPYAPIRNVTLGTYTGDPFVLNDYGDWIYQQCDSSTGSPKSCDSFYQWNLSQGVSYVNVSKLYVAYLGENNGAPVMTMYWWNWTNSSWFTLPNTLTFKATAAGGVPSGVDEYLSNSIPLAAISNATATKNLVRVRLASTAGSTFKQFDNWLVLRTSQYSTTIEDLKGSGEVHVSSSPAGENRFFKITTCNGFIDGRCGIFTNDDEYDLREGEIEDYFNIIATSTKTNIQISYDSPFATDCTALYYVEEWNGTAWIDFTDYDTTSQPATENCVVTLNHDISSGTIYQFRVKFDNYMKWEVDWTKKMGDTIFSITDRLCAGRNFTYVNPITDTTIDPNDTITDFCNEVMDDKYWVNLYWNNSLLVDNAGDYSSYVQEMRYYRNIIFQRYMFLTLGNNTNEMSDFYATKVWNKTIRNLTYYAPVTVNTSAIATDVWNATNRNLTYYQDKTNYTNITVGVWNYTGNVSSNIITQWSDAIWSYVGRYVHGILYS